MRKSIPVLLFVLFVLSGCSGPTAVLNLQYQGIEKTTKKHQVKVAMVEPKYVASSATQSVMSSPLMRFAGATGGMPLDMHLTQVYYTEYAPRIQTALLGDIERILAAKGFIVTAKYASMDEIPYAAKKQVDLIVVPEFDFAPMVQDRVTRVPIVGNIHSGEIHLVGRLEIDMVEPMSKELIVIKKVDVSSARSKYSGENEAKDTLINLLNTSYPDIIRKAAAIMDADEIVEAAKDVKELKKK